MRRPSASGGSDSCPGVPLSVETVPDRLIHAGGGGRSRRSSSDCTAFRSNRRRVSPSRGRGPWRQHLDEAGREGLPPLRGELSFSEFGCLRRWWRNFTRDDRNWSDEPTLVHGDLRPGDLLVDPEQTELIAVDGFQSAALGDPAIDFAGLVRCTGAEFSWRVVDAYRRGGGRIGADVLRRVRLLGTAVSVRAAARAARNDGRGGAGNDRRGTPRRARAKRAAAGDRARAELDLIALQTLHRAQHLDLPQVGAAMREDSLSDVLQLRLHAERLHLRLDRQIIVI